MTPEKQQPNVDRVKKWLLENKLKRVSSDLTVGEWKKFAKLGKKLGLSRKEFIEHYLRYSLASRNWEEELVKMHDHITASQVKSLKSGK